jgi:hypothetical protein
MILVVITLLMLQLQSFSKTAVVVLTAPLGWASSRNWASLRSSARSCATR